MLVFTGTGRNEDYGHMLFLAGNLVEYDWFEDCVSYYVFVNNNREEDIIPQIPKLKRAWIEARAEFAAQAAVKSPTAVNWG